MILMDISNKSLRYLIFFLLFYFKMKLLCDIISSMAKDEASSWYEFYNRTYQAIVSRCSPKELEDCVTNPCSSVWDMVLPKGCAKLKIKGPAVIEFKYKLGLTITRFLNYAKKELPFGYHLYVVYMDSSISQEYINQLQSELVVFLPAKKIIDEVPTRKQRRRIDNEDFPKLDGRRTLFIGAGVSMAAGLPSWETFLDNIKECIRNTKIKNIISEIEENNLIIKAQKIIAALKEEMTDVQVHQIIKRALYAKKETESHLLDRVISLIQNMQVDAVVTYNYDDIIERKLEKCKVSFFPILEGDEVMMREGMPILHVHGYIPKSTNPTSIPYLVLDESSYNRLFNESYMWINVEQLHYMRNTNCVFLGFSMKDPNLRRLLELANKEGSKKHCVFLKKDEHCHSDGEVELTRIIMSRLGLNVIWFNKYEELPDMLDKLFNNSEK